MNQEFKIIDNYLDDTDAFSGQHLKLMPSHTRSQGRKEELVKISDRGKDIAEPQRMGGLKRTPPGPQQGTHGGGGATAGFEQEQNLHNGSYFASGANRPPLRAPQNEFERQDQASGFRTLGNGEMPSKRNHSANEEKTDWTHSTPRPPSMMDLNLNNHQVDRANA